MLFLFLSLTKIVSADQNSNWQEAYAENMARFSAYHNECVHRCDDHFWRLSEWLAGVAASSVSAYGGGVPTRPSAMPRWNARHADLKQCADATMPEEDAPAGHKKRSNGTRTKTAPLVLPIVHGDFNWTKDGRAKNEANGQPMEMQPSVTLVIDHSSVDHRPKVLLVDTGLPSHRQAVLSGTVVTTHPDAHSMGNLNLFPCAEIHSGTATFRANVLRPQSAPSFENNRSELPFRPVSEHADLYLTPGISLQDQSLVVRGVKGHGTVAIVGKLVLNEQDLSSSDSAMRAFGVEDGEHRKLWQATRREIVCLADFIIPGFGVPFKVSETLKRLAECGTKKKREERERGERGKRS
ncbi:hypothetical protein niasHT_007313 [Heterodera trifolii]|uniref:Uncharacterized protein n=1 Tax=Heterodera trifolii TaxID=157864 RepID=A0ABD2LLA4_9BILA